MKRKPLPVNTNPAATRISVRLPKKLRDHYERIAKAEERSFSFIIARTLRLQAEAAK